MLWRFNAQQSSQSKVRPAVSKEHCLACRALQVVAMLYGADASITSPPHDILRITA